MRFGDLLLFYVVTALRLRWIATAAAAGPSSLLVWILGCVAYFVPLVFCVLELSSRYPGEGGMYVWTRRACGEFAGFMTGFLYWAANLPYYPGVFYFAAANALFIRTERWQHLTNNRTYFIVFALAGLLLGLVLNILGLNVGKWLHNLGAIGAWVPALLLIGMGFVAWLRFGSATRIAVSDLLPGASVKNLFLLSTVAFAFGGVEGASTMGEEIDDARRNIPRALLAAGVLITFVYIAGTASILAALPADEVTGLQGFMQAISKVAGRIGLDLAAPFVALLVTISSVGAVSAFFAMSARLPFVAGIDKFLPSAFGWVHPRWRTPYVALILQAVISTIFIFLSQAGTSVKRAYDVLVSMGILSYFVPFFYMFAAVIRLQREPAGPEVRRVPGGKPVAVLLAVLGLLTTTLSSIVACIPPQDEPNKLLSVIKVVGSSLLMVGIGAVIYALGKSRRNLSRGLRG